jgi:hypothetical protein
MRLHFNANQIKTVFNGKKELLLRYRLLIIVVVGTVIIYIYPILLILLFGCALPLLGGWLTLKSLIEDRQKARELDALQESLKNYLRQSIATHSILDIPLRDDGSHCIGLITGFDASKIDLLDVSNNTNFTISLKDVDIMALHYRLTGGDDGRESEFKANKSSLIMLFDYKILSNLSNFYSYCVSSMSKWIKRRIRL